MLIAVVVLCYVCVGVMGVGVLPPAVSRLRQGPVHHPPYPLARRNGTLKPGHTPLLQSLLPHACVHVNSECARSYLSSIGNRNIRSSPSRFRSAAATAKSFCVMCHPSVRYPSPLCQLMGSFVECIYSRGKADCMKRHGCERGGWFVLPAMQWTSEVDCCSLDVDSPHIYSLRLRS